jgi:uncharacterized protein (DUF305 family)
VKAGERTAMLAIGMVAAMVLPAVALDAQERERREAVVVQPGAPGSEGRHLTIADLRVPERPRHIRADVRFMQNMIHHHHQALLMSRLAPERARGEDLLVLAARIERAQSDEIALMKRWLELRGEEVPELPPEASPGDERTPHRPQRHPDHPAHAGHALMAGMLTLEQLEELAAARGEDFERLFLRFMIHHHEGALQMVEELFQIPGAARDTDIFLFASDVANDQQAEIARMRGMLVSGR